MKKIPSLFCRNYDGDRLVRDEIVPGSEWVVAGEGIATEKIDGTACMVRDGALFKRYDAKKGKTPPAGWEPCEDAPDPKTGHHPGWLPVGDGPDDRWHREAHTAAAHDGTYELVGPKVQSNPYCIDRHILMRHGCLILFGVPRDFAGIRDYLNAHVIEGIVWHHPDGRMVKIKAKDFGITWPRHGAGDHIAWPDPAPAAKATDEGGDE